MPTVVETTDPQMGLADIPQKAVELAAEILKGSRERESSVERKRSSMMARMMDDPPGKKFTIAMADQVLRMERPARAARRMETLVKDYGVPKYFGSLDRLAISAGTTLASLLPGWVMPVVKDKVRKDSEHVIISAEENEFSAYLKRKKSEQVRVNFNQLGEAVLGDHEADRRLRDNKQRLLEPGVDYISVKLSSIVSQISLTGYENTIETIKPRLRELYQAAIQGGQAEGKSKFVNLDMEEYRDLHLTVDVFKSVLGEKEFDQLEAGIVLQAYLPDSYEVLKDLTQWARERHQNTGTGIKIRLVKGANLAMEQVEASIRDWEQAPYHSKLEVDANYKRMVEFATRPENAEIVRIGIGSHNLFDIAFALLLREQRGVASRIEFEMLEGMADAQSKEVQERSGGMLVYTPVVLDAEFESAVAYLVRRLDENTAPGSFLGALFALEEGSPDWIEQRDAFLAACDLAFDPSLDAQPNRTQNRLTESPEPLTAGDGFHNAPDTDFSIPANRKWCSDIHAAWKDKTIEPIPAQIAGQWVGGENDPDKLTGEGYDPSRPGKLAYRFTQATADDIEQALATGVAACSTWSAVPRAERAKVLRDVAVQFAKCRGDSIGAMLVDAGKAFTEGDVEVSEAIDFANYYAQSLDEEGWFDGTEAKAVGVVVITPPWNFPYAIPAGGVLAALMAGNSVIFKPAPESVLTAWVLANQFWDAGVPKEVLQFVPTTDDENGKKLIVDPRTAAVILTGSSQTAKLFHSWRPDLNLYAETSGKNCLIISAAADLDLAIKDLVRGAFGHAGQKCSATSLALVEAEVYDNPKFLNQLKDAARSLKVGGSWNLSSVVTPVIRQPDEYLHRGLTQLDEGESWLLEPEMQEENPCLWSPGIRMGVQRGSWYHRNECFGPVLGLIRVENIDEAIEIQNDSQFGLTGGIHTLDPNEIQLWRDRVEVGNAYINRTTTGAIVRRQPFGGWKNSCVGPGPKAGGPNYVSTFCDWTETSLPSLRAGLPENVDNLIHSLVATGMSDLESLRCTAENYQYWWEREFGKMHDPSQVHGETNDFRYVARPWHAVRVGEELTPEVTQAISKIVVACWICGTQLLVSQPNTAWGVKLRRFAHVDVFTEDRSEFADRIQELDGGTLRFFESHPDETIKPAELNQNPILSNVVYSNGRIELLNYLKEQAISETVHRYGNIV